MYINFLIFIVNKNIIFFKEKPEKIDSFQGKKKN